MGRTNSREAAGLNRAPQDRPASIRRRRPSARQVQVQAAQVHESFTIIHSSAGGNHAAHGGRAAGGLGCIHAIASLGTAGGRLPDHSGGHVLSGSGSGCDGFVGHVSAGAAIRPGARPEPDDVDQFIWQLGDHAAVRPRSEYRRGRAAGTGCDQLRLDVSADGSARIRRSTTR